MVYEQTVGDPEKRTTELVTKYKFVTRYRWKSAIKGFAADLSEEVVEALRCESGIAFIEQNERVGVAR